MPLEGATERGPLRRFCFDLALPRERPLFEQPRRYGQETARAWAILARRYDVDARAKRKRTNLVWVDSDGAERAAALQEAVTAWAQGDVPPALRALRLLALDYEAVMDGVDVQALNAWSSAIEARYPSTYRFEGFKRDPALAATFERHRQERADWLQGNAAYQRMVAVLQALCDTGDAGSGAVLYVDHIHRLLGGDGVRYPFDLAIVLKPLLHRREIQLWGACTLLEYQASIEHDASMQSCLEAVRLPSSDAR